MTTFLPTSHHRKTSGPKPSSVPLLWCPSQQLPRKDPSSPCPDGWRGDVQSPRTCLLGSTRPKHPPSPGSDPGGNSHPQPASAPALRLHPLLQPGVFPCPSVHERVPCILSCQRPNKLLVPGPKHCGPHTYHHHEASPAPSHRQASGSRGAQDTRRRGWGESCKESPVQGEGEAAGGRWAAPGSGGPSPRLAQLAAPAPITAWLSPTAAARPGQLSVQPRANKEPILWAEGGQGHREDVWAM